MSFFERPVSDSACPAPIRVELEASLSVWAVVCGGPPATAERWVVASPPDGMAMRR
jgi:hypothetical protein